MSQPKKGLLPRIEILIVLVFFLSFIIWAVSKCNATQVLYQEAAEETAQLDSIENAETVPPPPTNTNTTNTTNGTTPIPAEQATPIGATTTPNSPSTTPGLTNTVNVEKTKLYVVIDGLNMRTAPRLNAQVMDRLQLYDEVWFMNEKTDTTQTINLGKIVANEPWVKVQNKKGKVGWVYGAGVHYYKTRLEIE